jgi:hypothetical protein
LGAQPLEPVDVKFCLCASLGVRKFYSEPVVISVVPTNAAKQFPHIYFIGSYCGWNHKEAQLMYDYSENGINYQAVVDLGEDFMTTSAGGFKLTPEGNWNAEWAEPAAWTDESKAQVAAGTLEKDLEEVDFATGGGDCLRYSESHRFYHFSLYTETNVFSMQAAFDVAKLVLEWIKNEIGGLEEMKKINEAKAKILYDFLDNSKMFKGTVVPEDRSLMNVPFVTGNEELDAKFVKAATEAGFVNLKGHRSVGGMRASIYNAMPTEGVEKLVEFMAKFEKEN